MKVGVPFHVHAVVKNTDGVAIPYPGGTMWDWKASDNRITFDNPAAPDPYATAAVPLTGVTVSLTISYTTDGLPFTHSATSPPFTVESNRTVDPVASMEVIVG